jgi:hypothetical protein
MTQPQTTQDIATPPPTPPLDERRDQGIVASYILALARGLA